MKQTPELRRSGIGGSDAAAVCGLSRWKTPVQLYLEKIGDAKEVEETEAMHFGNILEEVVAQEFARLTGLKVRRDTRTFRHKEYPHLMAHADRRITAAGSGVAGAGTESIGLECKTAGRWYSDEEWGETGTDFVPADYFLQCQHCMLVTGWSKFHLAVLLAGNVFRHYEIPRDDVTIASLVEQENAFWKCVQDRTPPPEKNTFDTRLLYPRDSGDSVIAPEEIAKEVYFISEESKRAKELEASIEQRKTVVQSFMKNSARLINPVGEEIATWRLQDNNRFSEKEFQADYPEMFVQYKRNKPHRVFRPKGAKV